MVALPVGSHRFYQRGFVEGSDVDGPQEKTCGTPCPGSAAAVRAFGNAIRDLPSHTVWTSSTEEGAEDHAHAVTRSEVQNAEGVPRPEASAATCVIARLVGPGRRPYLGGMGIKGQFPFGQPLHDVAQRERNPKSVFVLGVYASAVHARWIGPDGKDVVKAMAVASEPEIFWRGEDADRIVAGIEVPPELGRLLPASAELDGPSGRALDELFLRPLGVTRDQAWLCDLVPHSCVNPAQQHAVERAYLPLVDKHDLPRPSVPPVPARLADDRRRAEIVAELHASQADLLVLLGDQPIRWFLRTFDPRWRRLSDFTEYGRPVTTSIEGRKLDVMPLVHPRQAARLGRSSANWHETHQGWVRSHKPGTT